MSEPFSVEAADLELIGSASLIVADRSSGVVSKIDSNDGSWSVAEITSVDGANWRDIAVGDFEGDGDVDLLIAGYGNNAVELVMSTCCPVSQV